MYRLFENQGNWYKGNLHTHTTVSDGRLSPETVMKRYYEAGYDFLALTDHLKPGKSGKFEDMVILSGAEWHVGESCANPIFHILALGTESDMGLPEKYKTGEIEALGPQFIIDRINEAGGIAVLAHPAWSLMDPAAMFSLKGLTAVEIYNSVSAAPWNANRADSSQYFDLWASKGCLFSCTASDDSHFYEGEDCSAFTMVNAEAKTEEAILKAMREGNFYASQGPLFEEVEYDEKGCHVAFGENIKRVIFYTNAAYAPKRAVMEPGREACYVFGKYDRYVRIELTDSEGKKAWTAPFAVPGAF